MKIEIFILLLAFIGAAVAAIHFFVFSHNIKAESSIKKKTSNILFFSSICMIAISLISIGMGRAGVLVLNNTLTCNTVITCAGAILLILDALVKYQIIRSIHKHILILLKILLFSVLLECFIFNAGALKLLFGDYTQKTIPSQNITYTDFSYRDGKHSVAETENKNPSILVSDINEPVGTVYLNLDIGENTPSVMVRMDYSDDTYVMDLRQGTYEDVRVLRDVEASKYLHCEYSGNTRQIKITFNFEPKITYDDTSDIQNSFTLESVVINKPVPFNFSIVRMLTFTGIAFGIYILLFSALAKKPVTREKSKFSRTVYVITTVLILSSIPVILLSNERNFYNQMTHELVDAFESGQLTLADEPEEKLLELDNPYDSSQRNKSGAEYKWDHLLFEGKYYSYYGIAPVVLLFLPFHLITGHYFPAFLAVFIFCALGTFFLSKLYISFVRRKFPGLPFGIAISGFLLLQITNGVFFLLSRASFYEIAGASGFACIAIGAFFLITSGVIDAGKLSHARLCFASLFLALAVLCRPTLALYSISALLFIFFGFLKQKRTDKRKVPRYLLSSLLPFIVLGGVQMLYNYARFGSIFDFGIQYSLTINDFTGTQFHLRFMMIGISAFPYGANYDDGANNASRDN